MKKSITIIEEEEMAGAVIAEALKVLKAVEEQYDHQFELISIVPAAGKPAFPPDAKKIINTSDGILAASSTAFRAIEEEFPVFSIVHPISVYNALQHLSPLKTKYNERINILIYQEQLITAEARTRQRIAHSAFQQAANRNKKITIIENPDDQEQHSWKHIAADLNKTFGNVTVEWMPVATALQQLVQRPEAFDTLITDTVTGYYLFHFAAALSGTKGLLAQVIATEKVLFFGPADPAPPKKEGQYNTNPIGTILSVAMMLDYFMLHEEALSIRSAVNWTILHGFVTKDIDPVNNYATAAVGDLVSDFIRGTIPGFAKGENMALQKSTII